MFNFEQINNYDRDWYNKDTSRILSLIKLIRMALLTGEELLEDDFSDFFDFEPNSTLVYISLFQAGKKMLRYGSKRVSFIKTVNRDIEMIRKNQRFSDFELENDEKCRIMFEVMQDRVPVSPESLNTHKFDDTRFESGVTGLEIRKDGISYYDFKELKNAVEELGGEYKGSKFTSVKQIH